MQRQPVAVTVMWRPGCPFCALLLRRLERTGLVFERVDIWQDPGAAAWVRQVADGNETVPTVRIAAGPGVDGPELALVNPSTRAVIEAVDRFAPHALRSDDAGGAHGPGSGERTDVGVGEPVGGPDGWLGRRGRRSR